MLLITKWQSAVLRILLLWKKNDRHCYNYHNLSFSRRGLKIIYKFFLAFYQSNKKGWKIITDSLITLKPLGGISSNKITSKNKNLWGFSINYEICVCKGH